MESAGKTVDDEELREAMKENGIGRPSTRAAIIETLFRRRYIFRERKNIVATNAGIELIATIGEELLKSAKLTGIWENKLRRIERGQYQASEFISELKEMISAIVLNVLTDNTQRRIEIEAEKTDTGAKRSKSKKESGRKKRYPGTQTTHPCPKDIRTDRMPRMWRRPPDQRPHCLRMQPLPRRMPAQTTVRPISRHADTRATVT